MPSEIHTHDSMERLCKDLARRFGWDATINNRGVDPIEPDPFGQPRQIPNRGDVVLVRKITGSVVTFEYYLPEDLESVAGTIRNVVESDPRETDRRRDPGKIGSPIIVGE